MIHLSTKIMRFLILFTLIELFGLNIVFGMDSNENFCRYEDFKSGKINTWNRSEVEKKLQKHGMSEFLEDTGEPSSKTTPMILIDAKLIFDCKGRWFAERYISNKLWQSHKEDMHYNTDFDHKKFKLSKSELEKYKEPIIIAVYTLLHTRMEGFDEEGFGWLTSHPGNISHNLNTLTSDELLPEWEPLALSEFANKPINFRLITPKMFQNPSPQLLSYVERDLTKATSRTYFPDIFGLFCLKRNAGQTLDYIDAKRQLNLILETLREDFPPDPTRESNLYPNFKERQKKYYTDDPVANEHMEWLHEAMNLLKRRKITREAYKEFSCHKTGDRNIIRDQYC